MVGVEENTENQVMHFNFDKMHENLGNDRDAIKKVLLMVLGDLKSLIQKSENYIFNEHLDDIKDNANKLVGITASVGLDRLCTTVKKFEHLTTLEPEALKHYLPTLKSEVNPVKKLIKDYLLSKRDQSQ